MNNNFQKEQLKDANVTKSSSNKALVYYLRLVIIFAVLSLTFWIGFERGQKNNADPRAINPFISELDSESKEQADFSLFWRVWDLVQEKHVDAERVTPEEFLYNSIDGMLKATDDPYTAFLDPDENKEFNSSIQGKFEGIGAEMSIRDNILTVVAPLQDSPAQIAGLRAGDKVIEIEGEPTAEMSIGEAVNKIRGEKGTDVKLTIFRSESERTKEVVVTRDVITVDSVSFEIKNDDIAYFSISRFGENTAKLFRDLSKKIPSDTEGIIVDMRNNPGGYLDAAVDIASSMLPRGKIVVIEEDKEGNQKKLFSRGGDKMSDIETVILINEGSASASEILSGALRDNRDNVLIVGKQSFGKGSVQELVELRDDAALKVTIAKWLTPNGKQINEVGISPDIEVEYTDEDYETDRDPQLDKAIEVLKGDIGE
jgi:carboxyl-terminal processing protease